MCNTLGNKATKKVPRREVESFFREERNVTTGLVSFTHHRIQIITILVGTDVAKKTFKNLIHSGGMMLSYEESGRPLENCLNVRERFFFAKNGFGACDFHPSLTFDIITPPCNYYVTRW